LIGIVESGANEFLPFFLVLCFLNGHWKSLERNFGSKPKKQSDPSTSDENQPYDWKLVFVTKTTTKLKPELRSPKISEIKKEREIGIFY
jgi:hypothetical protein